MDHALLDMLACPECKGDVIYRAQAAVLVCKIDRLAFPVRENKPVMLVSEAQSLSVDEVNQLLGKSG